MQEISQHFGLLVFSSGPRPCPQDGVEQAFYDVLPWNLFSLRINNSLTALATLDKTLAAIPQATIDAMRSTLYCAWPRLLWLRHDPGATSPLPGQSDLLRFDAFETVMWTLRNRLRGDAAMPRDWSHGCRAVRRYFRSPPAGIFEWRPWQNHHNSGAFDPMFRSAS